MKKLLLPLLLMFSSLCFAQKKIELKDAFKHVGDSVTVEGFIAGVKTFPDNKKAPVLLNLGADFPKQLLTIAVFPSHASDVIVMPDEDSKGAKAIVTGKIELYKGKPQIAVRTPEGLRLVATEAVTPVKQ